VGCGATRGSFLGPASRVSARGQLVVSQTGGSASVTKLCSASGAVMCLSAIAAVVGCSGSDATYFIDATSVSLDFSTNQPDLCHPNCSSEAFSPELRVSLERHWNGLPVPVVPGEYTDERLGPNTTGLYITKMEVGDVCDDVDGPFPISGVVTITALPSPFGGEVVRGSYQLAQSSDFSGGTFEARSCP
jgi:hypothetical protein